MQQPIKRLGEMLVEGGLISPAQLQSAITHQKIARGRLGSNLVALGYISEEVLMDFLSHQTGVPQLDVRGIEVPPQILKLVPHRLAEQFTVLPIATKEPKSLVLAMSDPSDLNAIDSARFASGLHVEPVVASHSALRKAIAELYRRLDAPASALTVELGQEPAQDDALPVNFSLAPLQVPPPPVPATAFPRDPFFDGPAAQTQPLNIDPFGLFDAGAPPPPPPPAPLPPPASPALVHSRTNDQVVRRLESYQTRTLVLGLIRLFQRRGIIGQDELQRLIANMLESGEMKDDDRVG
jgi:Type II secretion system (T2SS), protein E, N-terminal domain